MRFESKFELGDEVFYYDKDDLKELIKSKIIYIEAWVKLSNNIRPVPIHRIDYTIEFQENGRIHTRTAVHEDKLMTKQEAKAFYDNSFQEGKARLFGEEALIKLKDCWTEEK
jgi:hypothetical protein